MNRHSAIKLYCIVTVVGVLALVHTVYRNGIFHNYSTASYSMSNEADGVTGGFSPANPLVIWSMDYHIGPITDLKNLLEPLGVRFIDKSLSGHCHLTNSCEGRKNLRVINRDNALTLNDPSLIPRFFESYKNDTELQSVDAFVCLMAAAICELYEPFNKTLLVLVVIRYEWGREDADRWTKWNENLIRMSKNPRNIIAANNMYDAEYVRYFTGIQPILLSGYNGYSTDLYSPKKPGFILGPVHDGATGFVKVFADMYAKSCRKINCTVELIPLRTRYPQYVYSDISTHRGVVHVPYQVSVISILEQYRMNIPMFFPSLDLLSEWQHKHLTVNEKTWVGAIGNKRSSKSVIPAHPSQVHRPDPNDDEHLDAIRYWLAYSDFYRMPHIWYFNSTDELAQRLETVTQAELDDISSLMKEYNAKFRDHLVEKWKDVLRKIAKYSNKASE